MFQRKLQINYIHQTAEEEPTFVSKTKHLFSGQPWND